MRFLEEEVEILSLLVVPVLIVLVVAIVEGSTRLGSCFPDTHCFMPANPVCLLFPVTIHRDGGWLVGVQVAHGNSVQVSVSSLSRNVS